MIEYLFILGRTSDLCQNELGAVLKAQKINYHPIFSSAEVFHLQTQTDLETDDLIKKLGGTIKIAKVFTTLQAVDQREIIKAVIGILQNDSSTLRINFGLSGYGDIHSNDLNHWSVKVKENLEESDLKVRFILPKDGVSLSSVVIKKQNLTEIILSKEGEKLILAKTLAIQDFEDWGKRDFGRPEADPHVGMLPPKVARMMVNLAILSIQDRNENVATILDRKIILDPFCGAGTILAEAMMMGYETMGTDISEAAVQKSQKNLEWLVSSFKLQSFKVFQSDATHVSEKIRAGSVDAIVTEPYLGPAIQMANDQLPMTNLRNIILGLDKLYLGCLREWRKILKPGGTVIMAFPSFKIDKQEFFVKKALDSCENLGYTLVIGPLAYSRPQAVVRRNIYVLKYGTH